MDLERSPGHRMMKLARTFPSLRRAFDASVFPWDAAAIDRWACAASHGERTSAQFILAVWDPNHE